MTQKPVPQKVQVTIQLDGDEAARFLAYKSNQFLRSLSEAARKLMLERLAQIEKEEAVA